MYIHIHIYIYIYIYVYVHHACIYVSCLRPRLTRTCWGLGSRGSRRLEDSKDPILSLSLYIYIYIHMYVCISLSLSLSLFMYIYIYIHMCVHMCVYTYVYIHIHIYIYMRYQIQQHTIHSKICNSILFKRYNRSLGSRRLGDSKDPVY